MKEYQEIANKIKNYLKDNCLAIYLTGSRAYSFITNPGDIDMWIIVKEFNFNKNDLLRSIGKIDLKITQSSQIREYWQKCTHLIPFLDSIKEIYSDDFKLDIDVLGKDRDEYINLLVKHINLFEKGILCNKKRWWLMYRYFLILKYNGTYLGEEDKQLINDLHNRVTPDEKIEEIKKEMLKWVKQTM